MGSPNFLPLLVCDPGQCRHSPGSRALEFGLRSPLQNPALQRAVPGAAPGSRPQGPLGNREAIGAVPWASGGGQERGSRELWCDEAPSPQLRLPGSESLPGPRLSARTGSKLCALSPQPMARFLGLCTWLLALGPGLLATVRAECSQDCATCSYRLARPTDLNPLVSVPRGAGAANPDPARTARARRAHSRRRPQVTQVSRLLPER